RAAGSRASPPCWAFPRPGWRETAREIRVVPGRRSVYGPPRKACRLQPEGLSMTTDVSARITEADIQSFQRDGAVRLQGVLDPSWVEQVAAGVERNTPQPTPHPPFYPPNPNPPFFSPP